MDPIGSYQLFCTLITSTAAVVSVVSAIVGKAKEPGTERDERIAKLEARMDATEAHLDADNQRLKEIEDGNRVTQKSLLALMAHAIDGNEVDKLREARDELQKYLIER